MRQFFLKGVAAFAFLWLTSCQYQFGESKDSLQGSFFIAAIENKTDYRLFSSELQSEIVKVIRRQRKASIASIKKADHIIRASIVKVWIRDKEIEPVTGQVIEFQLLIELDVRLISGGVEKKFRVRNTEFKESSGTFREGNRSSSSSATNFVDENIASRNALKDLAEGIFLAVSGNW